MAEKTLVMPVSYLAPGCNWEWMEDLNVLLVRETLSEREREEIVTELIAEWWRSHLKIVKAS